MADSSNTSPATATEACSIEQLAALDFQPLGQDSKDAWQPPSNSEWESLANPHLVTLRMAWLTLFKSKPEVVAMIDAMEKENIFKGYFEGIQGSLAFFKRFVELLELAEARVICAVATIARADENGAKPN
jgi:hypothetical protein